MFKKRYLFVFIIIVGILAGGKLLYKSTIREDLSINSILSSSAYAYLPDEAKEYVMDVYNETGELVLTEKNKKENTPYLNPQYVEYLKLSEQERAELDLIPNVYSIDYFASPSSEVLELPESYDLRNVDGNNYVGPLENQGSSGLCWAFATLGQAESYLMIQNHQPYNENTQTFSERQLDYATSNNGILDYNNKFGSRKLLYDGANFSDAIEIMAYGLSLVDESLMPFDENSEPKKLSEVLNFNNSLYEVEQTIELGTAAGKTSLEYQYGNICSEYDVVDEYEEFETCIDNYQKSLQERILSEAKDNVMKYGGAYAGTVSPNSSCAFQNSDGSYVINVSSSCYSIQEGHAMHVIGWDDNYEYEYCDVGKHNTSLVNGVCEEGELTKGKGAFILKNSWGDKTDYGYVYLTYNSFDTSASAPQFSYITSMSSNELKNWDNVYPMELDYDSYVGYSKNASETFENKLGGIEKLEKIKFIVGSYDSSFTLNITSGETVYSEEITKEHPGIYTVDLSDKNIYIDSLGTFTISISSDVSYLTNDSISAYTSNVDEIPMIQTDEIVTDDLAFVVYSDTKNIDSNELITYKLYDGEVELENYLVVKNNEVAANNVNASIEIVGKIEKGEYTLVQSYNDYSYQTKLTLTKTYNLDGDGTIDSPYIINNQEELKLMSDNLSAYYKLNNDIVLTEDWIPVGTMEDPFTGGFDGNGHTISNLTSNSTNLDYIGLFGYVNALENSSIYFKNITIKDANISGINEVGILIGHLQIQNNSNILIDSIYMIDGFLSGNYAGSLIGYILNEGYSEIPKSFVVNNVFSSVNIYNSTNSGIIGFNYAFDCNIDFSNIQNIGITSSDIVGLPAMNTNNAFIGQFARNSYNINNFIFSGFAKTNDSIFNHLIQSSDFNGSNGYYIKMKNNFWDNSNENVYAVDSVLKLKNEENYQSWENFDKYWKIETIDGITRIPILKGVNIPYTTISDISINVGETVSLLEYISPTTDANRIFYQINDNKNLIEVSNVYQEDSTIPTDITIKGLEYGEATIHIVSSYDGYEKDIKIAVVDPEKTTIIYHSNDNNDETYIQKVELNTNYQLIENTFVNNGYKFKNWNTNADGSGNSYTPFYEMDGTESVVHLYAQWEPITYKVIFHSNNGTDETTEQNFTYNKEEKLIKNPFTNDGSVFMGWNTKPDGTGVSYSDNQLVTNLTSIDHDEINLYAKWSKKTYDVNYFYNLKDKRELIYYDTYEYDEEFNLLDIEEETGYKIVGWGTNQDGTGINYLASETVKNLTTHSSINLYTIFEPITYKVVFNSNHDSEETKEQVFTYDNEEELYSNTFERNGYTFDSWNTKADGSGTTYSDEQIIKNLTINDNETITLYAIWEKEIRKIIYNANNGTEESTTKEYYYDEKITLEKNTFTKEGYTFKEWNTKADGTGTTYQNEEMIIITEDITLYAIWEEEFDYIINNYSVDYTNNYISKVIVGTTIDNFKNNITLGKGYSVDVEYREIDNNRVLYTGGKTLIYKGDKIYKEFTNVVIGDINGDGMINSADLLRVRQHLLGNVSLTGEYFLSSDINYDNSINSADLLRIRQHLLGSKPISE